MVKADSEVQDVWAYDVDHGEGLESQPYQVNRDVGLEAETFAMGHDEGLDPEAYEVDHDADVYQVSQDEGVTATVYEMHHDEDVNYDVRACDIQHRYVYQIDAFFNSLPISIVNGRRYQAYMYVYNIPIYIYSIHDYFS